MSDRSTDPEYESYRVARDYVARLDPERAPRSLSENLGRSSPACLAAVDLGLRVEVSTDTIDLSPRTTATNPLAEGSAGVFRQTPSAFGIDDPAAAEELSYIDYLWDASPRLIRKLRYHCFHFDGDRFYDYRSGQRQRRRRLVRRLEALHEYGHTDLYAPEPTAHCGFGYEDAVFGFFNLATSRHYEALLGMELSGFLEPFRRDDRRRLLWDPAPEWGGFAQRWHRCFPRSTMLLSDHPLRFLFSLTYLRSTHPEARFALADRQNLPDILARWSDYDFIFVPTELLPRVADLELDGLVDLGGLSRMPESMARAYLEKATELGDPPIHCAFADVDEPDRVMPRHHELLGRAGRELVFPPTAPVPGPGTKTVQWVPSNRSRHFSTVGKTSPTVAGRPRVGLGMTVHNGGPYLKAALDSVLAQTHDDFVLVVIDDASSDGSSELLVEYAARDSRIRLHRCEPRVGMVRSWQLAFERVEEECPGVEFFAWVSDHDYWVPEWLATQLATLLAHPEVVLAYPLTQRIGAHGELGSAKYARFETRGLDRPGKRTRYVLGHLSGTGSMVYGLMRAPALRRAGVFRPVLLPDRMLIHELALQGTFHQTQEFQWVRRVLGGTSIARQRRTLFTEENRPRSAALPWWVAHAWIFLRHAERPPGLGRIAKLELALRILLTQGSRQIDKRLRINRRRRRALSFARRRLRRPVRRAQRFGRRWLKRARRVGQIGRDLLLRRQLDLSRKATSK